MGYVAVSGGREAIENAEKFFNYKKLSENIKPVSIEQIKSELHLLVDRVMGEGSLYAPDLAALAIKQSAGDTFEAAFILRAYRTTLPRIGYTFLSRTEKMRVIRRISAAFKDIPGGQILGPTSDYSLRLLDFSIIDKAQEEYEIINNLLKESKININSDENLTFVKLVEILRKEGFILDKIKEKDKEKEPFDITRRSIIFPLPRSAIMQTLARGETGGLIAIAYSNVRGFGVAHPTIAELRVGYLPVYINHPYHNEPYYIGEILVTEAEVLCDITKEEGETKFSLGYGVCFGHNEAKAISMAILDRALMTEDPKYPSESQEFVIYHVDGVESMGFINHFKLPHYVTFQSLLDRVRKIRKEEKENENKI